MPIAILKCDNIFSLIYASFGGISEKLWWQTQCIYLYNQGMYLMILDMFFMSFFYQSICYFLIVIYTCKANVPFLHLGTYDFKYLNFKFKLNNSFDG